ncbi:acyltransferase family protein [Sarocladium implicatum]|nr:acyltransferase family protein [Sarocladium implicatum]
MGTTRLPSEGLLPQTEDHYSHANRYDDDREKLIIPKGPNRGAGRDKIRCLDGLRGIACLLVFNYHFLWPWTPAIMLGYGALPPRAPEPYTSWLSWPILCLLNRGRPMVAIFFAISGYVLCRHILRAIHERRLDAAYQSLASSVFRRVFRLYIPPTISMFIVAVLAQTGAFRSEESIYQGPDSHYINGTVSIGKISSTAYCTNNTIHGLGPAGVAEVIGVPDPTIVGNETIWGEQHVCVNMTSRAFSPSLLYLIPDPLKRQQPNKTAIKLGLETDPTDDQDKAEEAFYKKAAGGLSTSLRTPKGMSKTNKKIMERELKWVQFGGSWEEHPFIHDNATYAMQNFTRSYAEWANPFNFGHYHPRYDPHTFTIPMELRGSMVLYIFLLGTAALQYKWRLRLAGVMTAYSLTLGRWDMATFMGGMTLSEMDIRNSDAMDPPKEGSMIPSAARAQRDAASGFLHTPQGKRVTRWATIVLALYLLSYPDAGAEYTPGFIFLSDWVPKYYIPLSGWMFYQAMGALLLLPCVLRSPSLVQLLESGPAQHMGRISFSFYLVHGPVLHCIGFWIMPRLFDSFGQPLGLLIGYVALLALTLWLSGWWYRKIDVWSMGVGKRVEKFMQDGQ